MQHAHIQSFWLGLELPRCQQLCLKSFIDHGHSYDHYTYEDSIKVPLGIHLKDASKILPKSEIFQYEKRAEVEKGSLAAFSNMFRYRLLMLNGGWWVDTDVLSLSLQVPDDEIFRRVGVRVLQDPPLGSFLTDRYK